MYSHKLWLKIPNIKFQILNIKKIDSNTFTLILKIYITSICCKIILIKLDSLAIFWTIDLKYIRVVSNPNMYWFPFVPNNIMDDLKGQNWERVERDETKATLLY